MIHEEICTYEVCKLARDKGFPQDECGVNIGYYAWDGCRNIHPLVSSFAWYDDEYNHDDLYLAPTQALLQRWLRAEKGIDIEITVVVAFDAFNGFHRQYDCQIKSPRKGEPIFVVGGLSTYELALEEGLKYTLENLI